MIKAYRLYTGPDGHSHIESGTVSENIMTEAVAIRFNVSPPHASYDWHTAPEVQYVLTFSGTLEFEVRSGETFLLRPGEVLLAMDTTGSGHTWRLVDEHSWQRAYVVLQQNVSINFIPDYLP
ncbi:hypothetical protein [Pontibacter chitinilyticus]|uniref:hypothetical protein n=1 Tax=Pontibacter chitinilyticus TaxID=2674989 RepID=UPI003219D51B